MIEMITLHDCHFHFCLACLVPNTDNHHPGSTQFIHVQLFCFFFFSWYSIKSSLMLILLEFRLILSHMGCTNVHGHSVSPGLTRLEVQLHHTWGTRLASYIPVMHPPQTGSIYLHRLVSLSLVTAWILLTIKRTSLPLFACCK